MKTVFTFVAFVVIALNSFCVSAKPIKGKQSISSVAGIIYVNQANTSGNYDGLTWATAYNDLQPALAVATAGDIIWVAKGTYYPTTNTTDPSISFIMKNDVAIYGGFQGNETMLSQRNWQTNETILSGDIDHATDPLVVIGEGSTLSFSGYNGNSSSVIANYSLNNTAILDGFTISGGNNTANGGGMANALSSPTITNVIFKYNRANLNGGGMRNNGSSPTMTNVTFTHNYAKVRGGGIYNVLFSSPTIINGKFTHNYGYEIGGAISSEISLTTIINSTFYNNYSSFAGAIFQDSNNANLYNCILWNNGGSSAIFKTTGGAITVTNCLIEPSAAYYTEVSGSAATIKLDPLFIDAANGDFRLKPCSPAIDKGATGSNIPSTDILGNARFDMPDVANEGTSIVDLGA